MKKPYLLRCPFCGSDPKMICLHGKVHRVRCEDGECAANPFIKGETRELAVYAWNKRRL